MDCQVLLYYNYTKTEEPEGFVRNHLTLCKSLDLKGRILVTEEGINGAVPGTVESTTAYMEAMKADPQFTGTMFKINPSEEYALKKMFIRYRPEPISLRLEEDINPNQVTGTYLSPQKFKEAVLDEQAMVVDARNNYKYDLRHSRGAVRPDVRSFRELPDWTHEHREEFMEKRVVTYCTGGIRREKFSGWLVREGFKGVGQLRGGIATYGKDPEVQGELWDGEMYVLDERIAVDVNQIGKQVIDRNRFDGAPCERHINCSNPECNRQILASVKSEEKHLGACNVECAKHPYNRYVQDHGISPEEVKLRLATLSK